MGTGLVGRPDEWCHGALHAGEKVGNAGGSEEDSSSDDGGRIQEMFER